jgi:DNA-directed RNA polymerase sigma subunit (sigma70/sigma32)
MEKIKIEIEAQKIEKAYKKYKDLLTPKQKEVITRYYGINEQVRHTLMEIGKIYGVTRERIRQIKSEALIRLKIKSPK